MANRTPAAPPLTLTLPTQVRGRRRAQRSPPCGARARSSCRPTRLLAALPAARRGVPSTPGRRVRIEKVPARFCGPARPSRQDRIYWTPTRSWSAYCLARLGRRGTARQAAWCDIASCIVSTAYPELQETADTIRRAPRHPSRLTALAAPSACSVRRRGQLLTRGVQTCSRRHAHGNGRGSRHRTN